MNLSQAFTQHYMSMDPEDEQMDYDYTTTHRSERKRDRDEEPSNVLMFPVIRSESWRQVRMEAQ